MSVNVAMWSGPRNISTAMMRAWENRPDTRVVDEPFYACYLQHSGQVHPCQDEILAAQSSDWATVANDLTVSDPDHAIFYQKHMTHHMLEDVDLGWTRGLRHCFLIRHPERVIQSYLNKRDQITQDDIGILRQRVLFDQISEITGQQIPIIDTRDVLKNPEGILRRLCAALDLPFSETMLSWPAGRRDSDGVWAPHWYHAVEASTGFMPWQPRDIHLSTAHQALADACLDAYQHLHDQRLRT